MQAVVCFPDCHVPFEDQAAYDIAFQITEHIYANYELKELVLLGDFIDVYGMSLHDKDPSMGDIAILYDLEFSQANARLDQFDDAFPGVKKVYIEGNHEYRMKRFLNKFAGPLRNRISIPGELGLYQRPSWKFVPYSRHQKHQILNTALYARHEPICGAKPSTQAERAGKSYICGHTHRTESGTTVSKIGKEEITYINAGCLVDIDNKVFDYCKNQPEWTHSIVVIWIDPKTNEFHPQVVRIRPNKTAIFDGVLFKP